MVMSLLSDADCERIRDAVRRVERSSAVELVVAVLPASGDYWWPRVALAAGWTLAATLALLRFGAPPSAAVLLEIPLALGAYFALGTRALQRPLVPPQQAEHRVRARALQTFAERGVHRTRDRTGLLIFVSELERRVVILGDSGLHEHIGDSGWQAHVDHLVHRIHEQRLADGILEVLERVEERVAGVLPPRPDDTNELADDVVRD